VSRLQQKRKGILLHSTLLDLRSTKTNEFTLESIRLPAIEELYSNHEDEVIISEFLPIGLSGMILNPDHLYIIVKVLIRNKQHEQCLVLLQRNPSVAIRKKNIMIEKISLLAKFGYREKMHACISDYETRYGTDSVHSKILTGLLISDTKRKKVQDYIKRMEKKFGDKANYELMKAALSARRMELAEKYAITAPNTPRDNLLALRTFSRMQDVERTSKILERMIPSEYNQSQILEIVRTSLRMGISIDQDLWRSYSGLDNDELRLESLLNSFSMFIKDGDFEGALSVFKKAHKHASFTRHQILQLIRTTKGSPEKALDELMRFGRNDAFLLSCVVEFGCKYNLKNIANSAFRTLEAMAICSDANTGISERYMDAVYATGDIKFFHSMKNSLNILKFDGYQKYEMANYLNALEFTLGEDFNQKESDERFVEARILCTLLDRFVANNIQYQAQKKVLIVNNSVKFGGAERQVVRCLENPQLQKDLVVWNKSVNTSENSFINEVIDMGIDVYDYSIPHEPESIGYPIELESLLELIPNSTPLNPGIKRKIKNLVGIIEKSKPSTIHLWQDTTNVLGAISALIAGVPRIIMSARSLPPFADSDSSFPDKGPNYFFNNRFVRVLYRKLLSFPNVYLTHNSKNGLEMYEEWLGGYRNKMTIMRNGYDFDSFKVNDYQKENKDNKIIIGTVFRFVEVKRPFLWIKVAKKILETGINAEFWLIGDGPLMDKTIQFAKELGVYDNCRFYGYRNDVKQLLPNFDAFLMTSSVEGLPNVLIEAQAYGIPVVSTNAGGAGETFIHNQTGILVTEDDENILCEALRSVLHPEFSENSRKKARKFVEERFGILQMYERQNELMFGEIV
jgi:glycosyltransferase involved in cell wall biosynthesis